MTLTTDSGSSILTPDQVESLVVLPLLAAAVALGVTRMSQLMHHTHEHQRTATVELCCGTTKGEHP